MKPITPLLSMLSIIALWGSISMARADGEALITVEKTFDSGTLIEHTVTARKGPHGAKLRLSQHRQTAGAPSIARSHLSFQHDRQAGTTPMTGPVFEALLADLMHALHAHVDADPSPDHLVASQFMGIQAMEQNSILAFYGYPPWTQYLDNPQAFSQLHIHTVVRERWIAMDVFSVITNAFAELGYTARFSGFEKLFVIPAGTCSFYPELKKLGIRQTDRFPYPGSIAFSLKRNHRQRSTGNTR